MELEFAHDYAGIGIGMDDCHIMLHGQIWTQNEEM